MDKKGIRTRGEAINSSTYNNKAESFDLPIGTMKC